MQFLRVPGLPRLIVTLVAAFALLFPELGHSLAHRQATEHEADAGHYGRVAIQLPSVNSLAAGDHEHGVHPHLDTLMVVLPALYWLYGERAVVGDEAEAEGWNSGPELATVRLA